MPQKKITDLQLRSSVEDDLNFPSDDTIQSYRVTGSQIFDYIRGRVFPDNGEISNLTLTTAVGSSALTIAVKTKAGTNPTAIDVVRLAFRNATLTSGSYVLRELAAAASLVISSGSTLGQVSGQPSVLWVYLLDNSGTLELAVSHSLVAEDELVSTTAEGGAGAADSATVVYSTTARSNVFVRLVGYILNTQTTAGTWASAGTKIQLNPPHKARKVTYQEFNSGSGTYYKPAGCTRLYIECVGSGGSAAGSATQAANNAANGVDGDTTTFGTGSLIVANGGTKGSQSVSPGGPGGTGTITAPAFGVIIKGQSGGPSVLSSSATAGPSGGSSMLGGGSSGGKENQAGIDAQSNTGGGGGAPGFSNSTAAITGSAGGGGGGIKAWIMNPEASYAYSIGAAKTGGAAGTSGTKGGDSGSGKLIVWEYYD